MQSISHDPPLQQVAEDTAVLIDRSTVSQTDVNTVSHHPQDSVLHVSDDLPTQHRLQSETSTTVNFSMTHPTNSPISAPPQQDTLDVSDQQHRDPSSTLLQLSEWIEIPNFIPPKHHRHFLELFSGPNSPLSLHIRDCGHETLHPFDILLDPKLDILDDDAYYWILRLIACKHVGSMVAAPPCTEYSLLKLQSPGPPPCRSPDCMDKPLFDTPECHSRFFSSREIIHRSLNLLHVNHIHGGYSSLEQPLSAMSWDEPKVQEARRDFLHESAIISHCRVKPDEDASLNKHWQFVSNITGFHRAELQCTCTTKHDSFAGKREPDGTFTSRKTAEYPQKLVVHLAGFLRLDDPPSGDGEFVAWDSVMSNLPRKPPAKFEHIPDGAGLVSSALWPLPFKLDIFRNLRKRLESIAVHHDIPRTLPNHIQSKRNSIPFNEEILRETHEAFQTFFSEHGEIPSFQISPDQPFRLMALKQLTHLMSDPDQGLIPLLEQGVDLGIQSPIPPSGTWPTKTETQNELPITPSFSIFEDNWHSAEADEDSLKELIQQEIDDGFVTAVGTLQQAQEQFGANLAIGKLGIASQQHSKKRLVLDSTVSGLNPLSQTAIQEKCSYPKLSNLQQCMTPATYKPCMLLNLDIKSAHKRIKVKPQHQGLLAFQFRDMVYHYKVLHFGGTCSAYYWTRLAAIFLRFFHQFLYTFHFALVFVDDFIFGLDAVAAPLQASTLLLCIAFLNIPLSWHNLELNHRITWIGWSIDSWSDTVSIPEDKISKLVENLGKINSMGKFKRNQVETVTGNLLWISDFFPFIRWTLGTFYSILSRAGIQLVRLNKEQIKTLLNRLDSDGRTTTLIQRPYIPQGSTLSRLGSVPFLTGQLQQFREACFDLNSAWAAFWNCRSNRVQIFQAEAVIIEGLRQHLIDSIPRTLLATPRRFILQAGADAFASQDDFGLGAWLSLPNRDMWCSIIADRTSLPERFQTDSLQKLIIAFETLAQCILLIMFSYTGLRGIDFQIHSKVDNQASEAIIAQGFTQLPLPLELVRTIQRLCYISAVQLQPYRCSSQDNTRADNLSRGFTSQEKSADRFDLPLATLLGYLTRQ